MARRSLLAIPIVLPLAFATALAQTVDPGKSLTAPKTDYALTNVRIVTAPGRVIERGTVLTRDGRVAAVGANVTIPAGVVRMDLSGHTVYPGLIDAATSVGLPSPTRALLTEADAPAGGRGGRAGGGGRGAPLGRGGASPAAPVVLPEVDAGAEAVDMFAPTDAQMKAFRSGGVTTVGLVFNGGLFPGRVGAALTGSRDNSDQFALRAAVGQQVAFGRNRDSYPGTLIGALAFVRQAFLDAQYEARVEKAFKAGAPGARPSNNPFHRALMPAAANEMQTWFVASSERELARAAAIAKELGLKSPVFVGSREGWRAIPALKESGATAVVSTNWPAVATVTGRMFTAVGMGLSGTVPDEADSTIAREVRANAGALAKAGVPVAFASYGGNSGTTFRDHIRESISAGMSFDDALRAATVTPAALLGVTAAVGTIEVGKLANFVVVSGNDLFASGNPIKHVFVEGRIY
ncbi:MAG: amidohydrolase family protein [Gemmatimonadetes bacterium]|nr:amidohydrolase family protein [Gemmatimonadota bacterium]